MMFDLAAAKTRLGILPADTTKDAFLQSSLDVALSFAETYCDRWFMKQDETEVLTHDNGVISLHRYPLEWWATIATASLDSIYFSEFSGQECDFFVGKE